VLVLYHFANEWLVSSRLLHTVPTTAAVPKVILPTSLAQPLAIVFALVASLSLGEAIWGRRQTTQAWGTGAAGERATAAVLAGLIDSGFVVLHDRRMPGSSANIDHLVIGPSGVFTVESKNYAGVLRLGRNSVRRNGRRADRMLEQALAQARSVQDVVDASLVGNAVTVLAVVCVHSASIRGSWFQRPVVRGVRFCSGRRLAEALTSGPAHLTTEQIREVSALLDHRFPPVGTPRPRAKNAARTPQAASCSCGGTFVLRHRRSDGAAFYGCSRFPKCRQTRPA
jgi:hypothetical protein